MLLEVCCAGIADAQAAIAGGAHRIELCSALSADGVTPSIGLAAAVKAISPIPVNVLVREREGNFVYTPQEVEVMVADIATLKRLGVNGVVIGALTPGGEIDILAMQRMMQVAKGMEVTFHRAFDSVINPMDALEILVALGVHRVLTSGGAQDILQGKERLRELVNKAGERIIVLAGGGLTTENARYVANHCCLKEMHGSCRQPGTFATSTEIVKKIVEELS